IPWVHGLPCFLADFTKANGEKLDACPRGLLKKIKKQAEDAGFQPIFSQESECYSFMTTPQEIDDKVLEPVKHLTPGMFGYCILRSSCKRDYFNAIFDQCEQFGIPLEGLHTEPGPGVYEAAIQYSDILTAADRATLFKTSIKEIAYQHG